MGGIILVQVTASHQANTVILYLSHRESIRSEIHETIMRDVLIRRQRAESLELRNVEEAAFLLQRPFPSSMNAYNSQLCIIFCLVGGISGL